MSPLAGRRAGMAILSVELEELDADRVLIRVKTLDDVVERPEPEERAFAAASDAIDHLRDWLEGWTGQR